MTFIKRLWRLLGPHKRLFHVALAFIVAYEVSALAGPYIFKEILDGLINLEEVGLKWLIFLSFVLFAAYQINATISYWKDLRIFHLVMRLEEYLPMVAHEKLVALSLRYHEDKNTGSMIAKIQRGTDKLVHLSDQTLWEFIPTTLKAVLTFAFMAVLDWRIALAFVWVVPIFVWISVRFDQKYKVQREEIHDKFEEAAGTMSESIRNIQTVQSYAQEQRELRSHRNVLGYLYRTQRKRFGTYMKYNHARTVTIDAGRFLLMVLGIYWVTQGQVTPGSLVLFLTLAEKAYFALFRISRVYVNIADSSEAISRITDILDSESEVVAPQRPKKIGTMKGEIVFERVSFEYDKGKPILKNMGFTVPAGQTAALVGPSGSGKTTAVRMLYRHQDPTAGQVRVDGHDLKALDLSWYRAKMSIVTQDIDVFNKSVRENIAYGRPRATQREVEHAAKLANAHEFIQYLPQGYDTVVGEKGVKLSGGQKQRLGIARALLVEPKILVLDEATSSLDSKSERLIQEALERIMCEGSMTIIVIAHRLSTIKRADKILVLDQGRIVEEGRHYELIKQEGLYAKLHKLQFE